MEQKEILFLLFCFKSRIKENLLAEIIQFWIHEYGGLPGRILAKLSISADE